LKAHKVSDADGSGHLLGCFLIAFLPSSSWSNWGHVVHAVRHYFLYFSRCLGIRDSCRWKALGDIICFVG